MNSRQAYTTGPFRVGEKKTEKDMGGDLNLRQLAAQILYFDISNNVVFLQYVA